MPGAANYAAGGAITADTKVSTLLRKGSHTITRIDDLLYAPSGLNQGEQWHDGTAVEDSSAGEFAIWQNDDYSSLDYYGSASFTGQPAFNVYSVSESRSIFFWVVPDNHYWVVTDFVLGTFVGTTGDIDISNHTDFGGSDTIINRFASNSATFWDTSTDMPKSVTQYVYDKSMGKHPYVFQKCPPSSGIIVSRRGTEIAAGYQHLDCRLLVREIPVIPPTIEITVPGLAPVTHAGGDAKIDLVKDEIITYKPNVSGIYSVT